MVSIYKMSDVWICDMHLIILHNDWYTTVDPLNLRHQKKAKFESDAKSH